MEEKDVDFKILIPIFLVTVIVVAIVWLGYSIYSMATKDENKGVQNFEGDGTSNIGKMDSIENNSKDEDFFIQPSPEKKFKINNENPIKSVKDWGKVNVNLEGGNIVQYWLPGSTFQLRGDLISAGTFDMSAWKENGTYEEFIQDFIDTIKSQDGFDEKQYTIRKINIGGKEYYTVLRETEDITGAYFCLAKDGYAYFLEIIVYRRLYDTSVQNTIDKIFSTFTIL